MEDISEEICRRNMHCEVVGCPIIISRLIPFPGVLPNKYTRTLEELIYQRAPNEATAFAIGEVKSSIPESCQGVCKMEYAAVQYYRL